MSFSIFCVAQHQSKPGAAKAQLRLELLPASSNSATDSNLTEKSIYHTFIFVDTESRDKVRDYLSELLQQRQTATTSRNEANVINAATKTRLQQQILQRRPDIARLYDSLVNQSRLLTGDEFWRVRANLIEEQLLIETQRRGEANEFADLKPVADSREGLRSIAGVGGEIRFSLSTENKQRIFFTYPTIKVAFDANVPSNVSPFLIVSLAMYIYCR